MFLMKKIKAKFSMNWIHYRALTNRYIKILLSDKVAFVSLLLQAPLMAILCKLTCKPEFTYYDGMYTLFVNSCVCIFMGVLNCYREVTKERDVLIREYTGGLDAIAYVMSKITVQAIISFFQCIVIVTSALLFVDFPISGDGINTFYRIFMFYLIIYLTFLAANSIAIFISCILKNSESAILLILFLVIAQIVLSGALMDLPESVKPFSMITIEKWSVAALGNVFDIQSTIPHYFAEDGTKVLLDTLRCVYDVKLYVSMIVLVAMVILPTILSIIVIRSIGKKNKR